MALQLSKLDGMPILIGILKLPNVIRKLKSPLCKIQFLDEVRQTNNQKKTKSFPGDQINPEFLMFPGLKLDCEP